MEEDEVIETTGDWYLDQFLEEGEDTSFIEPFVEEEEFEDVDDDIATLEFLDQFLSREIDSENYQRLKANFGVQAVQDIGTQHYGNVHKQIAQQESNGRYDAFNPRGGGSGAVGKYQFRWDIWKGDIGRHTGVTNREDFLNNPEAQESFYNEWYVPKKVLPWVAQVKRNLNVNLPDDQLIKLYHFRGPKGATDYLLGLVSDKPEAYNSPISKYTGIKPGKYLKTGGWIKRFYSQSGGINYTPLPSPVTSVNKIQQPVTLPLTKERVNKETSIIASQLSNGSNVVSQQNSFNPTPIVEGAEAAAANIQSGMGIARNIKGAIGQGVSNAMSGAAALAASRLEKERKQQELSRMYETLQESFGDTTTETLGQIKNIWE